MQFRLPWLPEYVPALQAVQVASPAALYVPGAQIVQLLLPLVAAVPASHV